MQVQALKAEQEEARRQRDWESREQKIKDKMAMMEEGVIKGQEAKDRFLEDFQAK